MSKTGLKASKTTSEWPREFTQGGVMVRVFKCILKTGYTFYQVAYYQHGKRKREVLRDEEEAIARAKKLRDSLAEGEVDAASMRLQDVRAYESAKAILAPTGVSLETACLEYAEMFGLAGGRSPVGLVKAQVKREAAIVEVKTVEEVVDEYLEAKRAGLATRGGGRAGMVSEKYLTQLRLRLERFEGEVKGPIGEVTAKQINEFVAGLERPAKEPRAGAEPAEKAVSGRTRNNYLEAIRGLFGFAKLHRYVERDSEVTTDLVSWAEDDFEIEIYTADEMKALLAASWELLTPALVIGAFGGMRYYEITRLDWSEVKLAAGHIEVKAQKAKTRARRLVPIGASLAAWLATYKKESGPVWPRSEAYLSECLGECARAAGMEWKHNALRHSFISYRVAEVEDVAKVALEAGNSPEVIFQHYRELVTGEQAKGWFGITPKAVKAFKKKMEAERAAKVVVLPVERAA